ncbi:Ig-like domain-containing protein [Nitrobacter sp. TKz-YC01]|uniref:Ig-like domain-containing protein n=1 Tax=Nitrobacter sp. TKz-YC01 TaxID=3398703 RepID=UPI003A0FB891
MAAIPLSWNDPMFSGVTSSGSVTLKDGGTVSNKSITDSGSVASVVGNGSFTVDGVRINSAEGVRIGGSGDIVINNSYIETTGKPGDHADGIQAYAPGSTGNVTITNTTIVSHNSNATAGMFIADDYNGTFTFNNVVFQGGPFGLRLNADDKDLSVALKDVYFVGPFQYDPILFQEVNADINITQWDNVRYATIVNGELVPGALISPPSPVVGGATAPTPAPAPAPTPDTTLAAPHIASYSTDSGKVGDGITNDNTLTLTGSAPANTTVNVYDGASKVGTAQVNSSGQWSVTTSVLSDGFHKLTATDTNSVGKTSAASEALSVTIDTYAPTAPKMGIYSTSGVAVSGTTANNDIILKGTAEASTTVKVFDGGNQIGTATTNSSGAWSFEATDLANGGHNFTSKAMDAAGNTSSASAASGISVSAPTTAPTTTSGKIIESAGATSLVESGDKYYLNSSSGSGPSLKINGVAFVDGTDGTWAPIGAEKTTTGYQVAWKEASTGLYTAWNTDNNGNYVSHVSTLTGSTSGGVVSGTSSGLKSLETSFYQDFNGDGQIGASSAAAPTVPTSGQTIVGSTGNDTLKSTTGDDFLVGNGGDDTFVFADNFGNDTIKDFDAVGWRHDTIEFSKSVFDSFADVLSHASQVGQDVVISTGNDSLTLKNAKLTDFNQYDFHFA